MQAPLVKTYKQLTRALPIEQNCKSRTTNAGSKNSMPIQKQPVRTLQKQLKGMLLKANANTIR